jgi:hypothetical protein
MPSPRARQFRIKPLESPVLRRALALLPVAFAAASLVSSAAGSALVDRNATDVRLAVSSGGKALLTYRAGGRLRHAVVFGAVDARAPSADAPQVRFTMQWTGAAKGFRNACRRYDGPPLAWLVTACKAPDGSYWALQSWQRLLPHRGFAAWLPSQTASELHVSHWRGETARLEAWADWIHGGEAHDLFGRFTYRGDPVHGFRTRPADGYVRNLYIDTLDSRYGPGWKRETSVVSRRPNGNFCYSFYPTRDKSLPGAPYRPAGNGKRYRITAIGPGVTPDVVWEGQGLPDFDSRNPAHAAHEREMNRLVDRIAAGDRLCSAH